MSLLVVNSGSSSTKLVVLDHRDQVVDAATLGPPGDPDVVPTTVALAGRPDVEATVHRVVHGGPRFHGPVVVDDGVVDELEAVADLAPLHDPPALALLRAVRHAEPERPAVACFDTAFFAGLPEAVTTYPVPESWRRAGLRRYGFHGLSHARAWRRAAVLAGRSPDTARVVSAHLGSGASLAAVARGRPVDTTMGFTPLDGLVMATRPGWLDPGAVVHLLRRGVVGTDELDAALAQDCGWGALAGTTDFRAVLARAAAGDEQARLARDVTVHRLRILIGAMTTAAGGLDVLVFTGGAGSGSAELRRRACAGLDFLGVDEPADDDASGDRVVSAGPAAVAVVVVEAREDLQMAAEARRVLAGRPAPGP